MISFQGALHSILSVRVMLHLREVASLGTEQDRLTWGSVLFIATPLNQTEFSECLELRQRASTSALDNIGEGGDH